YSTVDRTVRRLGWWLVGSGTERQGRECPQYVLHGTCGQLVRLAAHRNKFGRARIYNSAASDGGLEFGRLRNSCQSELWTQYWHSDVNRWRHGSCDRRYGGPCSLRRNA